MTEGNILVTFDAVEAAASDVDATAAQIDGQLDDLKTFLAPMVATWTGAAAEEYRTYQAKWDTAVTDLNTILRDISRDLRTAGSHYQEGEMANTNMWTA